MSANQPLSGINQAWRFLLRAILTYNRTGRLPHAIKPARGSRFDTYEPDGGKLQWDSRQQQSASHLPFMPEGACVDIWEKIQQNRVDAAAEAQRDAHQLHEQHTDR